MSREEKLVFARERLREFINRKKQSTLTTESEELPSPQTHNDAISDCVSVSGQYATRNDDLYSQLIKAKNKISELMEVNARLVTEDRPQPFTPSPTTADDSYIRAFGDLVAEKTELMTKLSLAECRLGIVESQLQSDNVKAKTSEQNLLTLTESTKRLTMENDSNKNIINQYKQELLSNEAQLKTLSDRLHSNERELENYRSLLQHKSLMVVQYESELTTLRGQVNNFINSTSLAKSGQLLEDEVRLLQIQYDSLKSDHSARGDRINELENTLSVERNSFNVEFSSIRSAFEQKCGENDELVDRCSSSIFQLTESNKRNEELQTKNTNLSNFINDLLKENEENVAQIQSLIRTNADLKKADQEMITTNEQFVEMNARVMRTNDELTQINEQLSRHVESLFGEKAKVMRTSHQLAEDVNRLTKENEELTETRERLVSDPQPPQSGEVEGYKAEIAELNSIISQYKDIQARMIEEIDVLKVEMTELRSVCETTLNEKSEEDAKFCEEIEELRKKNEKLTLELGNNNRQTPADDFAWDKYYMENKRLWEVVEGLEAQNKAIGNYVVLYREQRHILNHKVIAKDEVIKQLTRTRDSYRNKLAEVRSLVGSLMNKEGSINNESANSIIEMTGDVSPKSSVKSNEVMERLTDVVDNIPIERLCKDCVGPIYIV